MRRTKAKAPKAGAVKLPAPRPLYGLQAELYALLVGDLEAIVALREKALTKLDRATLALAAASKREKGLRNQLAAFAPALEGFAPESKSDAATATG